MLKILKLFCLSLAFFTIHATCFAQSNKQAHPTNKNKKSSESDLKKEIIRQSALDLTIEIGETAKKILNPADRISVRINAANILLNLRPDAALRILDSAWQDSLLTKDEIKTARINQDDLQNSIIAAVSKIDPDRAEKWRKQKENRKTEAQNDSLKSEVSPDEAKRQNADILAQTALAGIKSQPQSAVSAAIASVTQTGKLSIYLLDITKVLNQQNQTELLNKLKNEIADFIFDKNSVDVQDLEVATGLFLSGGETALIARNKMLSFLLNSTRQILINQTGDAQFVKISGEKISNLFTSYQVFMKPAVARYTPERLPEFNDLLVELSNLLPEYVRNSPLKNSKSPEQQIEEAIKIAGSDARDARLARIGEWLLGGRMRDSQEVDSLELAAKAAASTSDVNLKDDLYDYIKLVEVERAVKSKDLYTAEKKAESISKPEWKAWSLAALGKLADTPAERKGELYFKAWQSLQKAAVSPSKVELAFLLTALKSQNDEQIALENLTETVRFANRITDENNRVKSKIAVFANIGESRLSSGSGNNNVNYINLPGELGKFVWSNWNDLTPVSQSIQNPILRSRFSLLLTKAVLTGSSKLN